MLFQGDLLERIPYLIAALIPALTFHEWGHARVALFHGDDTAKSEGRLSLNPLVHLDVFGTLAIFMVGFGWAKPVPVSPQRMQGQWAEFWVAAAGPIMNLALALVFALLIRSEIYLFMGAPWNEVLLRVFQISLFLNLALCFFNLLPIGPLDGNHIFSQLLPRDLSLRFSQWNHQYGTMLLFGLIIAEVTLNVGILRALIWNPVAFLSQILV